MAFSSLTTMHSLNRLAIAVVLLLVSACSSITSTRTVTVDSGQSWAVLPIENLSTTPMAGHKVATLVETQLRKRGVNRLEIYPEERPETLAALLDGRARTVKAASWALNSGFRYAITGSVSEWHYKSGTDKEPAVGVNLKLVDVPTGAVLWQANAARTGWGYANLSRVGSRLVADMVGELRIRQQSIGNTVASNNALSIRAATETIINNTTYPTSGVDESVSPFTTQDIPPQVVPQDTGPIEISIPGLGAALADEAVIPSDTVLNSGSLDTLQAEMPIPSGRLRIPGADSALSETTVSTSEAPAETQLSIEPLNTAITSGN